MDEFTQRLNDCGTQLLILKSLLAPPGGKHRIGFAAFRSITDILRAHGRWFEEQALNAAKRGERVALFERLALAFGGKTIEPDWLPPKYLELIVSPRGELVDETAEGIGTDDPADDGAAGRAKHRGAFHATIGN